MKFKNMVSKVVLVLGVMLSSQPVNAADDITCECLASTCGKCETETGVDFYTEKCGPGLSKLKSCKRPQCAPVFDHDVCLAKLNSPSTPVRAIAAVATPVEIDMSRSADVILAVGRSKLERGAANFDLEKGMKVLAGDRIVTSEDGRVRLRFQELSEIFVSPSSTLVISEALIEKRPGPSKRTIMLDLVKGRVRSRVQGRYDDGESKFQVKTKSAVAGVRGTDFVVTFEPSELNWKTEVQTLKGEVSLDGRGATGAGAHAAVTAGTYAAHIVNAPSGNASLTEIEAAILRGTVTPVFKMSDDDLRDLDRATDISYQSAAMASGERAPADLNASSLCRSPIAKFNQCSWTCEGNPKNEKKCRSDLPNVTCVRRLCRASGQWAEPTALPIKEGVNCEGHRPIVGDCGGYW